MGLLPTTRIMGPKGLAIINTSDLELYRAKGFVTEKEFEAEAKKQVIPKIETPVTITDKPAQKSKTTRRNP
jgi:hypothetical protein